MKSTHIEITKMNLGNYEVPVPQGLSDLLNVAGVWKIKQQNFPHTKNYDRRVEQRNGRLFSILILKSNEKSCDMAAGEKLELTQGQRSSPNW
ncbi:hypothetical protein [Paenibacillus larvae]|uniref:hypothetical protein n=1 Tax=Paenibacillus larvae TaxID=1464 RepID=UPI000627E7C9|nr:hypothetical protein [Paenibacillus larvae]